MSTPSSGSDVRISVPPADTDAETGFGPDFLAELDVLLRLRRDVRRFRVDPLDPELLESILERAELAPSVGNSQPWRWVEVSSASARAQIRANFVAANADALAGYHGDRARSYADLKLAGLDEAPTHLAVFTDEACLQGHGLGRATMPETLAYSSVAAIQTLWLAARARGIGLGWVSILDADAATTTLAVPDSWRLTAYLCLGYPETTGEVPELERVGWQARTDPHARRFVR